MSRRCEKVCIFVDAYSLVGISHGRRLDFKRLREWLVGDREAVILKLYCMDSDYGRKVKAGFYEVLKNIGFDIVFLSHSEEPGAIAAEITWDMCDLIARGSYTTFILISGNPGLVGVLGKVRHLGIDVEVVFPEASVSQDLRSQATKFRSLEVDQFQLTDKRRDRFSRTVCELEQ